MIRACFRTAVAVIFERLVTVLLHPERVGDRYNDGVFIVLTYGRSISKRLWMGSYAAFDKWGPSSRGPSSRGPGRVCGLFYFWSGSVWLVQPHNGFVEPARVSTKKPAKLNNARAGSGY